jgi:dTDP-4-dehydrorhamnose reductase
MTAAPVCRQVRGRQSDILPVRIVRFCQTEAGQLLNRNILIFGRAGQVGWELRRKLACLGHVTAVGTPEVDFVRPDSIRAAIRTHEPSVIVNAAAYTAVDKAESEQDLATAINATAPGLIAEEAKRLNALLVHYSTDYVFDGTKRSAWVESDTPNPLGIYGKTKLAGDLAIEGSGCNHLIFRTSWVYGARGQNFLLTMLKLGKVRPEIRIVDDQIGSPTSSECIAQATADVLAQVITSKDLQIPGHSGVYNLACGGEASCYRFAEAIFSKSAAKFGETKPKLHPIPTSEYPTAAKRPANSRLSCQRLYEEFGVQLPAWEEALDLIIDAIFEFRIGKTLKLESKI